MNCNSCIVATDDTVTDILVLPVLDIIIPVVLAVQLDGTLRRIILRRASWSVSVTFAGPPGYAPCSDSRALGGNALLIIGFGKVEVSFCQAEERELEPDARSGLIVKFDRRGAPLPGLDGGREIGLLAGIRHLTAPVVGRPARMARVIEGVEATNILSALARGSMSPIF